MKYLFSYAKSFLSQGNLRTVKAKKNIVAAFGIKGVAILIGLIKVPVVLSYLDTEKYGVWLTIASIVDWVRYFDLGIGHGLRNKFAEALAKDEHGLAKKLVSTAYYYISLIFVGICLLLIPLVFLMNWQNILNTTLVSEKELCYSVLVVLIMFVLRFILYQISVILKADQRPALSDAFLPIANLITLVVVLILRIFSDNSLILACAAISVPSVLVLLFANIYFFKGQYKLYKPSTRYVDNSLFSDVFSLGLKFFIIQIAGLVMFSSSNIILSQVVNPSEVTLYNITRQYFNIPYMIFSIILTPFWTAITDAYTNSDFYWIKKVMKKLLFIGIVFSIGEILMLVISPFIYKIWLGDSVVIPFKLSLITSILFIFYLFGAPFSYFLNGTGKLSISIRLSFVQIAVFFPIAIYLTECFGATGLVLSMIIVNSIIQIIIAPIQYSKIINKRASGIWSN